MIVSILAFNSLLKWAMLAMLSCRLVLRIWKSWVFPKGALHTTKSSNIFFTQQSRAQFGSLCWSNSVKIIMSLLQLKLFHQDKSKLCYTSLLITTIYGVTKLLLCIHKCLWPHVPQCYCLVL